MNKYLGILRWSLEYTDNVDYGNHEVKPMDEERRKWLLEAIESQIVDPVEEMKSLVKVLEIPEDKNKAKEEDAREFVENKTAALEQLMGYVENIDLASDLHKIGGLSVVVALLDSPHSKIRCAASEVVAAVVQNHPNTQKLVIDMQGLDKLMNIFAEPDHSDLDRVKALLGISSLIRGSPEATKLFVQKFKGVMLVLQILADPLDESLEENPKEQKLRLVRKSLFLLRYLLQTVAGIKVVLAQSLMSTLSCTIESSDVDIRENSLSLMEQIVLDKNARQEIPKEEMDHYVAVLEQYMQRMNLDAADPAVGIAEKILKIITSDMPLEGQEQGEAAEPPLLLKN